MADVLNERGAQAAIAFVDDMPPKSDRWTRQSVPFGLSRVCLHPAAKFDGRNC